MRLTRRRGIHSSSTVHTVTAVRFATIAVFRGWYACSPFAAAIDSRSSTPPTTQREHDYAPLRIRIFLDVNKHMSGLLVRAGNYERAFVDDCP